jgi:hypothetical protein
MPKRTVKEAPAKKVEVVSDAEAKLYAEEAHEFLKILGKWVILKSTHPSGYDDYHEVTRKWLESFKKKKD